MLEFARRVEKEGVIFLNEAVRNLQYSGSSFSHIGILRRTLAEDLQLTGYNSTSHSWNRKAYCSARVDGGKSER